MLVIVPNLFYGVVSVQTHSVAEDKNTFTTCDPLLDIEPTFAKQCCSCQSVSTPPRQFSNKTMLAPSSHHRLAQGDIHKSGLLPP